MSELVTLLTPTGMRPEAFALCEHFIRRQTYKGPLEWIVVDDGKVPTRFTMGQRVLPAPRAWEEGLNTHRFNMEELVRYTLGDTILIIEDDDWYHPRYIETMVHFLQYVELVGLVNSRYYNVQVPGWKTMRNQWHASLSQTAFLRSMLPDFNNAINSGELFFDVHLWKQAFFKQKSCLLLANTSLAVGMKGLPGRPGISPAHKDRDYFYDANGDKLSEWIGADVEIYKPYLNLKKVSSQSPGKGSIPNSVANKK